MTHYIYPQNLKAAANMWLWSLRDFAIMGVAALLSIVILVELHLMLPAAATLCYGFLTIRICFAFTIRWKWSAASGSAETASTRSL